MRRMLAAAAAAAALFGKPRAFCIWLPKIVRQEAIC